MRGFLVFCAVVALCFFAGVHQSVLGFLGIGSARFGISTTDPLGTPENLHRALSREGFLGDFGTVNTPRTIAYTNPYDEKLYPGFKSAVVITVGDEEYIQKIDGVFVGTQHGYSPQKPTMVEQEMVALWRAVGGPRAKFKQVDEQPWTLPASVKFGAAISLPRSHMESSFQAGEVKGSWVYSDSSPHEVITLDLR